MSTGASIYFAGMTYFQSHDGYPNDVVPEFDRDKGDFLAQQG